MNPRRSWIVGGFGCFLVLDLCQLPGWGDEDKSAPDGSHVINYSVKVQETVTGTRQAENTWEFDAEAFDLPGKHLPRRKVFISVPKENSKGPSLPVVAMQYRPRDVQPAPELTDMTQLAINEAFMRMVKGGSVNLTKSVLKKCENDRFSN